MPVWFPFLSVLLAILAAFFLDQTQGILQALTDRSDAGTITDQALIASQNRHLVFFLVFLCLWSVVNFFATGLLHEFDYNSPEYNGRLAYRSGWVGRFFLWLEKWSPLIVGLGPVVAVEIGFLVLRARYEEAPELKPHLELLLLIPCLVVLMAWRLWRSKLLRRGKERRKLEAKIPRWVIRLILAFLAFVAALVTTTARAPERWSALGPGATLCIAATVFVIVGSLLVFWGSRWRIPLVFICLVICTFFSCFNDNHRVRITRPEPAPIGATGDERLGIVDALAGWRKRLCLDEDPKPGQKTPLFIICAEGGGVRAAYWAARLLAYLEDTTRRYPDQYVPFSSRVLVISSVSGGSLGAATFSALLDRNPVGTPTKNSDWFFAHSANFLARDHLSAPLASAAFVDTTQRIIPWPLFIERDRAAGLERAWENAWHRSLQALREDSQSAFEFFFRP
jgi:hypothetical protein